MTRRLLEQIPIPFDSIPFSNETTSADAAHAIRPVRERDEARVLAVIRAAGSAGACDHEIENRTGLIHQTASARRRGLVLKGLVEASEFTRKTASGRQAIAWRAR